MSSLNQSLDEIRLAEIMPSKFGLELLADMVGNAVSKGEFDPLIVAIKMNAMEQLCKLIKERISAAVMDELGKYPKGKAEINGAAVSIMDSVKYDYSHLPGWQDAEDQIAELKAKQKEIEEHERTYFKGNLPIKSSTSTYKISLSK